jgi:hypothetical protein
MTEPCDKSVDSEELEQISSQLHRLHEEADQTGHRLASLRENLDQAVEERQKATRVGGGAL